MKLSTFNVNRLTNPQQVSDYLTDNLIDICGMQEVAGIINLNKLTCIQSGHYKAVFDESYKTYGNGLVYKSNYELVSKNTYIISNSGSKKSLFRVVLKNHDKLYSIYVTHLNHMSEQKRLVEWHNLLKHVNQNETHYILGDFNALTKSDYTKEELIEIYNIRKNNQWELPTYDLMNEITKLYHDCITNTFKITSRFNTRIDYIFTNRPNTVDNCYIYRLNENVIDHNPVICDIID